VRRRVLARAALQSLRFRRLPSPRYRGHASHFSDWPLVQSLLLHEVSPYWFDDPALPLDFSSALRFSFIEPRRERSTLPVIPLVEFNLRLERTLRNLVDLRADSSPELSLPSAHEGTKVHLSRALPAHYVPPSGFGYPLGGFLPSDPCRLCFTPAALLGFALRSFPLPGRHPPSFRKWIDPHTVFPAGDAPACARTSPTGRGYWVAILPRVPGNRPRV
jgi:hypothetical protein